MRSSTVRPGNRWGLCCRYTGTLSVRNQGPVMPDDELERLTKPFERGATTAKGSGLGLAVVEAIVRDSGSVLTPRSPVPGWQDGLQVIIDGLPLASTRPMRQTAERLTDTSFALAWRATFVSASCVMRNREMARSVSWEVSPVPRHAIPTDYAGTASGP
ncbi:sensor histidine kinase [Cupriavidus sp. GA3-3]|uniref:sensor histidine kinase n=1 Tax=Cupriavidus sp. GA3-3 TaxID=1229514 RepID=UPI00352724F7